jgi:mRNA interferase MazF
MSKDFDAWVAQKKEINAQESGRLYKAREVWWCVLGVNVGYEQDGTSESRARPVVILKAFSAHVCVIIPLSTTPKRGKYYFEVGEIDGQQAVAILSQIRLIDTRRLENKICVLEVDLFERIRKAAKDLL